MKLSKVVISAAVLAIGAQSSVQAHSGGAVLGADGTNPSATALAAITCFDDGNGQPAKLFSQIQDRSEPVEGLLLSMQIYKGNKATSITDPISGDADYSEPVELEGGPGVYWVMVNKTAAGPRQFDLIWHCVAENEAHTGTDIVVKQFQ